MVEVTQRSGGLQLAGMKSPMRRRSSTGSVRTAPGMAPLHQQAEVQAAMALLTPRPLREIYPQPAPKPKDR